MTDEALQSIDETLAAQTARRLARGGANRPQAGPRRERVETAAARATSSPFTETMAVTATARRARTLWDRVEWFEVFIAIQFLWGAFVFIPGAQQYRAVIRALPYASSLGMLAFFALHRTREPLPRGGGLLIGALILLVVNLLHPTSQLSAGVAQCVFQLSVAAPLFWSYKAVRTPAALERVMVLIFVMNAFSAGLGVLQVYFPDRFMPPELNSLGFQLNQYYLDGLTYEGSDGRQIVRPPGLTDQPGAAATSGALAALVGLGLLLRRRTPVQFGVILAAVTVGFAAIYLTQVRSILLAAIGASALLALVAVRRGRFAAGGWAALVGTAIVVVSFAWASAIGGESVSERFSSLQGTGAIEAYRMGRGGFVAQTLGELLDEYPLGAGVGRWGMMNTYFGNPYESEPIYVEIQLTGWLLDGGVLMWLFYGGALLWSLWISFSSSESPDARFGEVAMIGLGIQAYVVSLTMGAPVFNSQAGILFWTIAGALHGARQGLPNASHRDWRPDGASRNRTIGIGVRS